mgnify:CR=1 FL=1|tara:strand:+ start:325 stop:549 length:225 start_codon:yes stop_codon:yes gene_type:complete
MKKKFRVYRVCTNIEYADVEISKEEYGEMWDENDHEAIAFYHAKGMHDDYWKFQEGTVKLMSDPIEEAISRGDN